MGAYSLLGRQAMDCGDIVWQRCFKKPSYNERRWEENRTQEKKRNIENNKTVELFEWQYEHTRSKPLRGVNDKVLCKLKPQGLAQEIV
jgi:hypothetical protein